MKAVKQKDGNSGDKNQLSHEDLKAGIKTFEKTDEQHAALETPEGKNNGAEPAIYQNQRKAQT
jgi:septum formation inhibitor-activating ATPase MinD